MSEKDGQQLELLQQVIDLEWRMFQQVNSGADRATCQNNPEAFFRIRGTIFELWPVEMLAAYRRQLILAGKQGRNLLTEKYARMDRLIPPISTNSLIEEIVGIEERWQAELKRLYPALYRQTCRSAGKGEDGRSFSVYLQCELETYGDEVLALYHAWVADAARRNHNSSLEMLDILVRRGGFDGLEHAELYFGKGGRSTNMDSYGARSAAIDQSA